MQLHVPLVAYQELASEELGDDARALWRRVNEIGSYHRRVTAIPLPHGTVAAHGLVSIEEATSGLAGDTLLNGDDLGDGADGGDLVAVALSAVHGTHDEDGGVGEGGADAADGSDELRFVLFFDVGGETRLVGAVVDDDEIGVAMLERGVEGLGIEGPRHDGGEGSV